MRLTLRTLLSWKDGMLGAEAARDLAAKVEASDAARRLVARIDEVSRRSTVSAPAPDATGFAAAANSAAEYLDNVLPAERLGEFERVCFASDAQLAETAAIHELLAELSRSPPTPLDATARKRLLAAVRARATAGERPESEQSDAVTLGFPTPRPVAGPAQARPPRPARAPTSAWLLVAAALMLLAALIGVLGWSLTTGGRRPASARDVAVKPAAPVAPVADPPVPAPPVVASGDASPQGAAEPAAPEADAGRAAMPAAAPARPQPEPPVAAPPAAEPPAADFPPVAEPATEPAALQATVIVTVPVAPAPAAVDQRVPQGDALAIAAPAALPAAPSPATVAPPQPPAADSRVGVAGRDIVLFRAQGAAADQWVAGTDRTPLVPPVDLVAPPVCRPTLVIDGLRIALEPGTRAVMTRDADGMPRLELVFGAAVVAGPGRLRLTAGGLSGEVAADLAAPLGVEATLARRPGATATATQRVARILPAAGRVAWRSAAAAGGGAEEGADGAVVEVSVGQALVWRSDAPTGTSIEAAGTPPAWLGGRARDDSVDRWAADALADRLAAGTNAVPALAALAADRRPEVRVAAASALALVGEFDELARLLVADGREALRDGLWSRLDAVAVQPALARGPRAADALAQAIAAHAAPGAADTIVRFAHGLADDELAAGAAQELVDALESPHVAVRRYAIKNLAEITGVDDVDRLRYRADRPAEALREGAAWWRTQLEQGRIRRGADAAPAAP